MSDLTPLSELTVADLRAIVRDEMSRQGATVTGLQGIADLFGVSKRQASRIKAEIAPAVSQHGRTIIVDRARALQIYSMKH